MASSAQPLPAATASGRRFSELPSISPECLAVLSAQGFTRATPVQEATIPLFAGNKDVAVDAATGSGKTLAFIVPIVEKMRRLEEQLKKHQVRPRGGGGRRRHVSPHVPADEGGSRGPAQQRECPDAAPDS